MTDVNTFRTTLETLPDAVRVVLDVLHRTTHSGATVLALSGDLGAGKTTFVQALAKQLGILGVVNSPTFTIMRQYETTTTQFEQLIHMDAYRIDDVRELVPLRWEALLGLSKTLICVEWPEKIAAALPEQYVHITLQTVSETEREITIMVV